MTHIQLRDATAADEPFLFSLFAYEKARELAPLGWSSEQLQPLIAMQFRARQQSWAQTYPTAIDSILCLDDGAPVGRRLMARQANGYRLVDLAVLPTYRKRGIGLWAVRSAQELAASKSASLRLCVAPTNPALRLYQRAGFVNVAADEIAYEMEWRSPEPVAG